MASMPEGSNPAKGSSRTSSSGPWTRAAASCTRCWLPCDSASTLLPARSVTPRRSNQVRRGPGGVGGGHPVQSPEVLELLAHEHARIEAPFLGHVAEATALGLAHRRALPADVSGVEIGESEDGPHGGRLPRPVGTQEADDFPAGTEKERSSRAVSGPNRRVSPSSSSRPSTWSGYVWEARRMNRQRSLRPQATGRGPTATRR